MSDQTVNYARPKATAPILLGVAGAALGTMVAPVKRSYRDAADLLLMEDDKFQRVADKAKDLQADDAVKKLYDKVDDARNAIKALGDDALAKATKVKELLGKDGALEGLKPKKDLKGILPRAKGWWAVGLALVGLFIGRVISVNKANKKNMELMQQAQQNQQV